MKDEQTILLIGAAVAAYLFFMKKKPRGRVIVEDSQHVEFLPKRQRSEIREKTNPIGSRLFA